MPGVRRLRVGRIGDVELTYESIAPWWPALSPPSECRVEVVGCSLGADGLAPALRESGPVVNGLVNGPRLIRCRSRGGDPVGPRDR